MTPKDPPTGFRCGSCGQWHDELMTDIGFQLPDAVFGLKYLERYQRARYNSDLCTLDDKRYFIRCVLPVPFTYREDFFGWGVWVEVKKKDHDAYVAHFGKGSSKVKPFVGTIANAIKRYRGTVGLEVRVELSDEQRPFALLPSNSRHALAVEQRNGMDADRHHEIVRPHAKDARSKPKG